MQEETPSNFIEESMLLGKRAPQNTEASATDTNNKLSEIQTPANENIFSIPPTP